jgi:hypothetical protein
MNREITITVHYSDTNGGYMYSVYGCDADGVAEGADSFDGGLCTGTANDAIDMAVDAAKKYTVLNGFDADAFEQDCMNCEETFSDVVNHDYCEKCRKNPNRTDMQQ